MITTEIQARHVQTSRWPFSLSVVIPAFNEGPRVAPIVEHIRTVVPEAEIIVIDDASSDDTAAQAAAAGARVISRPHNVGNGAGVKTGPVSYTHLDVYKRQVQAPCHILGMIK